MTDAELQAILEYCEKATEGPWEYSGMIGDPGKLLRHFVQGPRDQIVLLSEAFAVDYAGLDNNLRFAANARTDLPAVIRELQEARAENADLKRSEKGYVERIKTVERQNREARKRLGKAIASCYFSDGYRVHCAHCGQLAARNVGPSAIIHENWCDVVSIRAFLEADDEVNR